MKTNVVNLAVTYSVNMTRSIVLPDSVDTNKIAKVWKKWDDIVIEMIDGTRIVVSTTTTPEYWHDFKRPDAQEFSIETVDDSELDNYVDVIEI